MTEEVWSSRTATSVKGRDIVVYAAQPLENVHEAVETVFHLALIGIPLLVLITGRHLPRRGARAAAGRGDPRAGRDDPRPVGAACRCRRPATRSAALAETMNEMLARLQAGQAVQRRVRRGRQPRAAQPAGDDRDRPGARWPARRDAAATATRSPPCAARPRGWVGWSTPCCCSPAPTRAACGPGSRTSTSTRWPRRSGCGRRAGSSRGSRPRTCGSSATGGSWPRWCATSSTTPAGTPARRWWSRCGAPVGTRRWTSRTTGRACRPSSGRACSSGSSASTTPGRARTAAPGWGSRSSRRWSRRTAAPWTSSAARWAGPCSGCGCRCPAGSRARGGGGAAPARRPSPAPRPSTV